MEENDKTEYRNWYKKLLRIQKKELILFGVLILLAFIFIGISSDICKWLKTEVIYNIVNKKPLINIPICIIISGFAIWWWSKIWKDKDIRPYRLGIIISLFIITLYSEVKYANITKNENISYEHFFIAILVISAIIIIIRLCLPYFTRKSLLKWYLSENRFIKLKQIINPLIYKQDKEPELKGFSVDDTKIELENNQIKYAETLVKKLKNTDLSKESFAVGITGEWGSGKSTFLNTMKKEIEEAKFAEFVEFNPWLCNSPEQVTQDFFATLINELSPKHSTLSRDINKYAKLLNKIAKASLSFFGIDLDLTPSDDSLNKLKDKISNKLANLPKKVVILIDDTDRLEGNEVFEILRLIRNTADFKNVIYIATYDKEYVTDVLKENKIKDPDNYLEKIFQVDVHLLKTESFELWDTLMEEIKKQDQTGVYYDKKLIEGYFYVEKKFILQILTNYRKVKRFARQYTLFLYYAKGEIKGLFSELDLFWLELLHIYDKNTYNILAKNPERLLYEENKRFHLRDNIPSNIKEYSTKLLNKLFKEEDSEYKIRILHDNNREHTNRIRMIDNYDYYFTINKPKMELTEEELDYHLNYSLGKYIANFTRIKYIEEIIQIWLYQDKKNFDSIINQFDKVDITKTHLDYIRNYIYSLLTLGLNIVSSDPVNDIKFSKILNLLNKDRYIDTNLSNTVNDYVQEYFNCKIEYAHYTEKNDKDAENLLTNLSKLLNRIHKKSILDENNLSIKRTSIIINDELIENQLRNVINAYLSKYKTYTDPNISPQVLDLMDPDKNLSKMFLNCFITKPATIEGIKNETELIEEQIAFKTIIDYFSDDNNKSFNKPRLIEYNERFNKLGKLRNFDSKDNRYCEYIYTMWSKLENLQAENIKDFEKKCFEQKQVDLKQVEMYWNY
ncbi:MAG: P-loop NTPase fold protein [Bacteroidales bacterium]|nr:P-loop NTPase fold protein [Bacteroidales bacterium]